MQQKVLYRVMYIRDGYGEREFETLEAAERFKEIVEACGGQAKVVEVPRGGAKQRVRITRNPFAALAFGDLVGQEGEVIQTYPFSLLVRLPSGQVVEVGKEKVEYL